MRHKKSRFQLNRFTSWRRATLVSLAKNLLVHQSIKTSLKKARAAIPLVETLVSLAKQNSLSAKRRAFQILNNHKLVSLLFNEIGPRFAKRHSGYTRVINLKQRRGDNALIVILELTEIQKKEKKVPKKEKEAKPKQEAKEEILEKPAEEKKPTVAVKEKPTVTKKPTKGFLGGLRKIFKKERDSL